MASSCNQYPGLRYTAWGQVIPVGVAIASPQADAIQRGVLCLRNIVSAVWGITHHRDPGSCSFICLPIATNPRLSSRVSNSFFPISARTQGKWLQMKFCALALNGDSPSLQLSFTGRQKPCCFPQVDVIWVPF